MELNNNMVNLDINNALTKIKTGIKLVLSGLQKTNFPIAYTDIEKVQKEYLSIIHFGNKNKIPNRRIKTSDFIGFSSISLEMENIVPLKDTNLDIPNINNNYTVTEKADGIRKLLFINNNGFLYFIDTNMNVQFTGCKTLHKNKFNTIIDGEFVSHNKENKLINLFLCFDIYIIGKKDVRQFPFYKANNLVYPENINKNIYRLELLSKYLNDLDLKSIIKSKEPSINIKIKTFYTNLQTNIFEQCNKILTGINDNTMFDYETDGLVFTPSDKSVASDGISNVIPSRKITWKHSLKWKPAKFNTIDFLVITKKNEDGSDFIGNIFENGNNLSNIKQSTKYKTVFLKVGFDENKHGYINPCKDILDNNLPSFKNTFNYKNSYLPKNFYPHDPTPSYPIYKCNILIDESNGLLFTEDKKQTFQDSTIVEFRFDFNKKNTGNGFLSE